MKYGTVSKIHVELTSEILEAVADGRPVHLTGFGDQVVTTSPDVVSMIIRELSSEKQIREFLRRHGISVKE